jgi:uncharacterized protein YndB with AHSA1/START domain
MTEATMAPVKRKAPVLKYVLVGVAAVVVLFLIVVALQPSTYKVERSATIGAPPSVVFAQVNDFHKWAAWNPWDKVDPAMKKTYEGSPAGVGAVYAWVGNGDVGEGKMTITESRPGELVRINMEFFKPMAGTSTTEFAFAPQGNGGTLVTWSMSGENSFVGKAMCLFMNMDTMVGGQFEKGLADMKAAAESAAGTTAAAR